MQKENFFTYKVLNKYFQVKHAAEELKIPYVNSKKHTNLKKENRDCLLKPGLKDYL